MDTLTILLAACIVAASSAGSAWLLARQLRTNRARERQIDYDRAKALSDRAAEQTRILIDTNERIAIRTSASGEVIEGKLDIVHRLVNSGLTAAKRSEAEAIEREVVLLGEVMTLNEVAGRPPTDDARELLAVARQRLVDLRAELAERELQDAATAEQSADLDRRLANFQARS